MSESHDVLEVDVLIVGAGPAGLAAAYRLATLSRNSGRTPSIALLEKSSEIGSHTISGAVLDLRALGELMPDWEERGAPIEARVRRDDVYFLTSDRQFRLPITPPPLRNEGCVVVSLNRFVRWFGQIVEQCGVDVFPGFAGADLIFEGDRVAGVRTGDKGRDRSGAPKGNFEAGVDIRARLTILAEGARGSLTKHLIGRMGLDQDRNPQVYSIGVKEVWSAPSSLEPGRVMHTMGFPLSSREFGGGFLYTMSEDRISLGLVIGLDYRDPTLDPHERFQAFKTHPLVQDIIRGGELIAYGAKAIPEGGYWSVPQCYCDGGLIIGDAAGFLNSMRLKGIHLAMKSGMIAGEVAAEAIAEDEFSLRTLQQFESRVSSSWIRDELWQVRNFHQGFRGGLWSGMAHAALQLATGGRGLRDRYPSEAGHTRLQKKDPRQPAPRAAERTIAFDGALTFDRVTDVHASGTRHEEDQPSHLVVRAPETCYPKCTEEYGNPCQYFCPAAVYEMNPGEGSGLSLQINASNCVHCKTCDIMDPYQVIDWVTPEGGDGPEYRYL